ncbi:MAG: aminodeoxychorismate/anthranilate synthase component II [Flavipsychrobacter sp.]|nr:aminodeoxychorismate/anthranilate synthase component II [Flavipsychrobacter sp.]
MELLIIDNYDSFTYNLVYLVRAITGEEPHVKRNDRFLLEEVARYDKVILSPGPGVPGDAGLLMELLEHYATSKCILGVCLGHQAIACHYGAELINMSDVVHGKETLVKQVIGDTLFSGLPQHFNVGRYHSWVVDKQRLPDSLEVTVEDKYGSVMALRHRTDDVKGVQFHPESIMTKYGQQIITNWINS